MTFARRSSDMIDSFNSARAAKLPIAPYLHLRGALQDLQSCRGPLLEVLVIMRVGDEYPCSARLQFGMVRPRCAPENAGAHAIETDLPPRRPGVNRRGPDRSGIARAMFLSETLWERLYGG